MSGIIAAAGPRGIFLDSARPGRWDGGTRPTVSHLPVPPSPPPGEERPMSNAPDQAPTNRPEGGAETAPLPPTAPADLPTLAPSGPAGPAGEATCPLVP